MTSITRRPADQPDCWGDHPGWPLPVTCTTVHPPCPAARSQARRQPRRLVRDADSAPPQQDGARRGLWLRVSEPHRRLDAEPMGLAGVGRVDALPPAGACMHSPRTSGPAAQGMWAASLASGTRVPGIRAAGAAPDPGRVLVIVDRYCPRAGSNDPRSCLPGLCPCWIAARGRGPEGIPDHGGRQGVSRSGSCPWHGRRSRSR